MHGVVAHRGQRAVSIEAAAHFPGNASRDTSAVVKDLLSVEAGEVTEIERVKPSTEVAEGEWVLDDARLEELGSNLWEVSQVYPVDGEAPANVDLLLDTEWKLRADGRLAIKQIRPFAN
jgi:hypothetical protein